MKLILTQSLLSNHINKHKLEAIQCYENNKFICKTLCLQSRVKITILTFDLKMTMTFIDINL